MRTPALLGLRAKGLTVSVALRGATVVSLQEKAWRPPPTKQFTKIVMTAANRIMPPAKKTTSQSRAQRRMTPATVRTVTTVNRAVRSNRPHQCQRRTITVMNQMRV
ncbi:UNVERIFIED_CONTAM: hypothetical protein FKN15_016063 [Acipenser sinensis]